MELHSRGKFTEFLEIRYVDGQVRYINLLDIYEFFIHELDLIMYKIGYIFPRSFTIISDFLIVDSTMD